MQAASRTRDLAESKRVEIEAYKKATQEYFDGMVGKGLKVSAAALVVKHSPDGMTLSEDKIRRLGGDVETAGKSPKPPGPKPKIPKEIIEATISLAQVQQVRGQAQENKSKKLANVLMSGGP